MEEALDTIAGVLGEGHVVQAVELAEQALRGVERAMESVHDDGDISRILDRLQELHRAACFKAQPEPLKLARRLFDHEMSRGYDVIRGAVATYADVLGKDGIAEYRRLAHELWRSFRRCRAFDTAAVRA